jgi:tRNA pseudouridine13 synthase
MYRIKQTPEDFVVDEISNFTTEKEGDYLYVLLKKENVDHFSALSQIKKTLNLKTKDIGFSGTKDKRAITTQTISLYKVREEHLKKVNIKGLTIEPLGYSNNPISLGRHEGNKFKITVRNLDSYPESINLGNKKKFVNYFGDQRFGTDSIKTGLAIMKKDFKRVCDLVNDDDLHNYLAEHPSDYVGAIRTLPRRRITLYVHSVQSHIWNILAQKFKDYKILPIPGYMTEYPSEDMRDFVEKYLAEFGLISRDFIIRKIPNLFTGGGEREREVYATQLKISKGEDELNEGKKKVNIQFALPKGSYATEFIKFLFGNFENV